MPIRSNDAAGRSIWPALIAFACLGLAVARAEYAALPLAKGAGHENVRKTVVRYGIPFIEESLALDSGGAAQVDLRGRAKRIFLLGMTTTGKPRAWPDPRNQSVRFFVGDELGRIRLEYVDGSTQVFPLILGESIWWGALFHDYPEPFSTDARLRSALREALRLYPAAPVADDRYVAVIVPRPLAIRRLIVEDSPAKSGVPTIAGITVEPADGEGIAGASVLPGAALSPEFDRFIAENPLRPLGEDENGAERRRDDLRRALYTSDDDLSGHAAVEMPPGYSGPRVSFQGTLFAEILANAFHFNLQDMAAKVGADGTYHTSTKDSTSWGSYNGFGTFRRDVGKYYDQSYSRDQGRSLQELAELGYTSEAARCADFCLRSARRWTEEPALKAGNQFFPPHWGQLVNRANKSGGYENDGHGLTTLFLYKLWQRLPDRESWLRARWPGVQAAGDWILWQFDHPEISGATDVLHTTGESAGGKKGSTVYADAVCRNALLGLAQMADSIGDHSSAARWRDRAAKMQRGIEDRYIVTDPKWGRVWTLASAGWTHQSTVLGPLIFLADDRGFAPEDDNPRWRPANEAAYRRLVDTYQPFGFYGQAMGYGQGFVTQAALLLDRMQDATQMLNWAAREIYDPRIGSYIVPEGCEIDPTGKYWYRIGDLGNGVQEAEIVKALRIMIGVDDTQPNRLQFFPRMPYGWTRMAVEAYPVLFTRDGKMETSRLHYELERSAAGMKLKISAQAELGRVAVRLGPFAEQPDEASVQVNGRVQSATVERSGDSWWTRFAVDIGPRADAIEIKPNFPP